MFGFVWFCFVLFVAICRKPACIEHQVYQEAQVADGTSDGCSTHWHASPRSRHTRHAASSMRGLRAQDGQVLRLLRGGHKTAKRILAERTNDSTVQLLRQQARHVSFLSRIDMGDTTATRLGGACPLPDLSAGHNGAAAGADTGHRGSRWRRHRTHGNTGAAAGADTAEHGTGNTFGVNSHGSRQMPLAVKRRCCCPPGLCRWR